MTWQLQKPGVGAQAQQPRHAAAELREAPARLTASGTSLVAGAFKQTLLRYRVAGRTGRRPAVLRMRVTAATARARVRVISPVFGEDDGTPASVAAGSPIATVSSAAAGTWVQWDVTSAVQGNGDVGLQVGGPVLDSASFSSREGGDAPQLVVTPDDDRGVRLAGLLDPRGGGDLRRRRARRPRPTHSTALDVIAAPAGLGIPGRYVGVHHTLVGGRVRHKARDVRRPDDLDAPRRPRRARVAADARRAARRQLRARLRTRHARTRSTSRRPTSSCATTPSWAALAGRRLRSRGEPAAHAAADRRGHAVAGGPSWNGPDASQIAITLSLPQEHQRRPPGDGRADELQRRWLGAAARRAGQRPLHRACGTRGNLGDRADLRFEGHLRGARGAVDQARLRHAGAGISTTACAARPAGSHSAAGRLVALGNRTVRALTDPPVSRCC